MTHQQKSIAKILKTIRPAPTREGVGAVVQRLIGTSELRHFDPFLMMDHFSGKLPGGFPDHPHRGFETVSYLLKGKFLHEDSKGHKGELSPGDVQWMTAGRGILHAEMPASSTEESVGFQLWINLPKDKKMVAPNYQEFSSSQVPLATNDQGVSAKVICGREFGVEGAVKPTWPAQYVDFRMDKNSSLEKIIPGGWNNYIYLFEGELEVSGSKVGANTAVFFQQQPEDTLALFRTSGTSARFLFVGGKPIGEPIAQYGPFVMNTQEEISQAFSDYQNGKNGFEDSKTWKSGIRKLSNQFDDE